MGVRVRVRVRVTVRLGLGGDYLEQTVVAVLPVRGLWGSGLGSELGSRLG